MKKPMQRLAVAGLGLVLSASAAWADAPLLQEGFDGTGLPAGWTVANFSTSPASEGWFRPVSPADTFAAESGAAESYIASSVFTGATDAGGNPMGRIDTMLATAVVSMAEATTLTFSTRTVSGNAYGESLRIGAIVAGSFVELMTINPSLAVGAFPEQWTTYSVTLAAQGEDISGRYYFEYVVPDASVAGNFIGLDSVSVTVSPVPEPTGALLMLSGGALLLAWRRRATRA
ncbi:MAG: hypothetical protein DI603_19430 [Roseateles depolymerans]|uniref:PEP-CTERM protein-sorting domain-containing protein n=1 Tax=Roseateles depolymerans TaxID=76731 RepID=A0A2W5DCC2_9BURK|nr:MAG: hypothetical protein DI603_19430 [Roseateles depolymerans]